MRSDSSDFTQYNDSYVKSPRFTIEIAFDTAATDLVYFTSHADGVYPIESPAATAYLNTVVNVSGTSQSLNPIKALASIGNLSVQLLDKSSQITSLINTKLGSDKGLRGKRLRVYYGFEDQIWGDYILVQTQLIQDSIVYKDGIYTFNCEDIQRETRKDIFDLEETTLNADLTATATTVTVISTTDIQTVEHGTSYSGFPAYSTGTLSVTNGSAIITGSGVTWFENSQAKPYHGARITINSVDYTVSTVDSNTQITLTGNYAGATASGVAYTIWPDVGYIKIQDEIICYPSGTVTSTTFQNCIRGALNTLAVEHAANNGAGDRATKVEELVYLEMPAIKLAYAILTGALYGQSTKELPTNWQLAVDSTYITQTDFTGIGTDLWDSTDDTLGFIVRFIGLKKQDAKQFIAEQLYLLCSVFSPIYANGTIGLKRMVRILEQSPFVEHLTEDNIVSYSDLTHDLTGVYNNFIIDWNYDSVKDELTRRASIIDATSITRHGLANPLTWRFRGLHGGHTNNVIKSIVERARDRYAGPPQKLRLNTLQYLNRLEIGDPIKVTLDSIRDFAGNTTTLNRTFEIQRISINWMRGCSVDLFGSSEAPTSLSYGTTTALNDAAYTSSGTNIKTYLDAISPIGYTEAGGVLTITSDVTLTGGSTLEAGRYYYDGDLTIGAGVTITITDNVGLWVTGVFTNNYKFDGVGQGLAGAAADTAGTAAYFGYLTPGGHLYAKTVEAYTLLKSVRSDKNVGGKQRSSIETFELSTDGSTIDGLPTDLRGCSGSGGGNFEIKEANANNQAGETTTGIKATGGTGGAGGAGLMIVCRGMAEGVSASYDLSGASGTVGGTYTISGYDYTPYDGTYYAGSGSGGAPGCFLLLLDGGTAAIPSVEGKITANVGLSPLLGNEIKRQSRSEYILDVNEPLHTYFTGWYRSGSTVQQDVTNAVYNYQFIPEQETAEEDPNPAKPVAPSTLATTSELKRNRDGTVIVGAHLTWTPSTDPNVGYYILDFKNDTDATGYEPAIQIQGRDSNDTYVWNLLDTKTYTFRLKAINKFGNPSTEITDSAGINAKSALPATPAGMTVTAGIEKIILAIDAADMPTDVDLASIEYWYSTTNNRGDVTADHKIAVPAIPSAKWGTEFKATVGTPIYVWAQSLDTSGNYSTAFYPAGATSGLSATPQYGTPATVIGFEAGFRETWENDLALDDWTNYRGSGELSIVSVSDSQAGGNILRVGNNSGDDEAWLIYDNNIPFDPRKLYKLTVRVRRTAGTGAIYAGWAGVLSDGITLVNVAGDSGSPIAFGGQHYHCIFSGTPTSSPLSAWTEYVGYTKGFGTTIGTGTAGTLASPGQMHPNVRYIRPLILSNYSGATGTTEIDSYIIEEISTGATNTDLPVFQTKTGIETGIDTTSGHIKNGTEVSYDLANYTFSINSSTFRQAGIQIMWDPSDSPATEKAYFGDGGDNFVEINNNVGVQVSGDIFTSGSFLTTAASASATTLNVSNTSSFPSPGSGYIIDNLNDDDAISWTGKTSTTLTGCTGVLAHNKGGIIVYEQSMVISKRNNEMYFYGSNGDSPEIIERLVSIGINQSGSDYYVGEFGSATSGNTRIGIIGQSYEVTGVAGQSVNGVGTYGYSNSYTGMLGSSNSGYGGIFTSISKAPLRLTPSASASAPTYAADVGALHTTSAGILYIYTTGSPAWVIVGSQ